ncbi:class III poly(R)-hydroxyalkanoic acid synthase subunit PhaE [Methylomagnum sp.]
MTDPTLSDYSGTAPWLNLWLDSQRQFWDAWTNLARPAHDASASTRAPLNPWQPALDFWTGLLRPPQAGAEPPTSPPGGEAALPGFALGPWADYWTKTQRHYWSMWQPSAGRLAGLQPGDGGTARPGGGPNPMAGFANLWGMPLDNWRRVCSAFSFMPGDMEKAVRDTGSPYGPESLHRTMVGFLSMPTVGYTREWQEELQRWSLLWLNHFEAQRDYSGVLGRIIWRAYELFTQSLRGKPTNDETLTSLRAFYNQWIDCAEEAYGEIAISPEFVNAQARLTNSLFAIKRQEQKMMEEAQSALNMPTRRELDTSHKRVHQLQRRVWEVERELEESNEGINVRAELAVLRKEVEALRVGAESDGSKPAPPRRGGGAKAET